MSLPLEEYAIIGDTHTAAVVGSNGSVDWLCLPRFDSSACFAGLLGTDEHGFWRIAPQGEAVATSRRYRGETLLLETDMETADGAVRLIDFMPIRTDNPRLVRVVEGLRGRVAMTMTMRPRFDYGKTRPWVQRDGHVVVAQAGPNAVELRSDVRLDSDSPEVAATFEVVAGERVAFVLTWYQSWERVPDPIDPISAENETEELVGGLVAAVDVPRSVGAGGAAFADHPEGADLRADRWHRRGRHDVAAGVPGRRPQLGLSLLLAA